MNNTLKYIDERDKSYGIAGMAISLIACDCEDYLASVSIEKDEESVSMVQNFHFCGNSNLSVKNAWNDLLREFQLASCMLIGNVMCRSMLSGNILDRNSIDLIRDIIKSFGKDSLSLEDDEIESIYNKNYKYYNKLFSHPTVATIARDFATSLRMQRRMSAAEVMEELHRLNSL